MSRPRRARDSSASMRRSSSSGSGRPCSASSFLPDEPAYQRACRGMSAIGRADDRFLLAVMEPRGRQTTKAMVCPSGKSEFTAIQRQVQLQHIHARLAEDAELSPFRVICHQLRRPDPGATLRACATRSTWAAADSGLMCGSSPLPEAVSVSARNLAVESRDSPRGTSPRRPSRGRSASGWWDRDWMRSKRGHRSLCRRRRKAVRESIPAG